MPQQIFLRILHDALALNASDIHIEALEHTYQVRLRVNTVLTTHATLDYKQAMQIIAKIKILAGMDIAESRRPQDGGFHHDGAFEARVSSCPGIFGEKIVLRILRNHKTLITLDKLGIKAAQQNLFLKYALQTNGLILINGPTGSGKTTTIYALLNEINNGQKNIISVENPVEIKIPGIHQIQVNPKIDLNFHNILKFILRQDPDIIVLGEIRDEISAKFAISAAQTGHLVIASLHSSCPQSALARMESFNIKKHDLIDAVKLIITQRMCFTDKLNVEFDFYEAS